MSNTDIHGMQFVFGFLSTDAPTISGFAPRKADLSYEPEVFAEATNGEGQVESIAQTNSNNRKITGTFTGYVNQTGESGAGNGIASSFNFTVNGVSRFFLVKKIGDPRNKGEFAEVTIDVQSNPLVTS